jgi:tetratricopeptide (TPR) repeat protein
MAVRNGGIAMDNSEVNVRAVDAASDGSHLERQSLAQLLQILDKRFDENELRTVCFSLDVDYDNLAAIGKAHKARELLAYLERRGRLSELIGIGEQLRPDIPWGDIVVGTPSEWSREGVQVIIDEINKQTDYLEGAIWAAVSARNFEEVIRLGTELADLEDRRRRESGALELRGLGLECYKKGMNAMEAGDRELATQEFQAAEESFRAVVDLALETDKYMPMYLTDLGNSLTMQGRLTHAIPFYERALQLSKYHEAAALELHKRILEIGQQQFSDNLYAAAIESFQYALALAPSEEKKKPVETWLALALSEEANARLGPNATSVDWDRSRALMLRAVYYDPDDRTYHSNLRTMQGGKNRPNIVFLVEGRTDPRRAIEGLASDDTSCFLVWHDADLPETLLYWLDLLLPEFRELVSQPPSRLRPIHVWWLSEGPETKTRLGAIGIPDRTDVDIALSHFYSGEHYIVLNASYHSQVDDPFVIVGDMLHELAHEAFKELGMSSRLPDWTVSAITCASNERITDLLLIYRGLGPFLLESRKYLEQTSGGLEGDYPALSPVEITRYLRREAEEEAKRKINKGAELKSQGAGEEAEDHFLAALQTCKRIAQEDPGYAFAWYELSIIHEWLGEKDEAVRAVQRAVILDPNPKYRQRLEMLRMSREEEARQLVRDGADLDKAGKAKPARRLFRRAETLWREYLDGYFEVARVHHELGITLEWQKRIPDALYEFRVATALDPRNERYASYLRAVLERYGA